MEDVMTGNSVSCRDGGTNVHYLRFEFYISGSAIGLNLLLAEPRIKTGI